MKNIAILLFILIGFSCGLDDRLTDLTPDTPHEEELAFNLPEFYEAIPNETGIIDSMYHFIERPDFLTTGNPFLKSMQWVATDTFTFQKEDYQITLETIQKIANGFDIVYSSTSKLRLVNVRGWAYYSKSYEYTVFPFFNAKNQIVWLQVQRKTKGWFTKYTVTGYWLIGEIEEPGGDIS